MGACPRRGALVLYTNTSQSAINTWGWGFRTVRGGFGLGDLRFRPQVIELVKLWNEF